MSAELGFSLDSDPINQFQSWFEQARTAKVPLPEAMSLATSGTDGKPSVRMVLLKDVDANGFVFFTNYESAKSQQLLQNRNAALLFHWAELERQVRIDGQAYRITREESEEYFRTRPRESQLGAWASRQSQEIESREALENRFALFTAQYEGQDVPCPPHWGGFRLEPEVMEFWQGRPGRMHDRIQYYKRQGVWAQRRLCP